MAVVEAPRRTRDPGRRAALVERERVRVAPRGGAELAPPRILQPVPAARPLDVVVTPPAPARTRRQRRPWSDERKRRFRYRFLPTATALILAPAPIARVLIGGGSSAPTLALPPVAVGPAPLPKLVPLKPVEAARGGSSLVMPEVVWHDSISLGLPYHGRLIDGVQLPVSSPYWATWDPALDRVPDRGYRRYGSAKMIHLLMTVTREFHDAHPNAARLVIGDISRYGGGPLDEHASHQNGLDVDVYYPRTDKREVAPTTVGQVDVPLAQDLLDMFLAFKPEFVFVGPHLPLHGPAGVVEPLVGHDNHMHVRIYPPS
ncbi:MAG TPA: penicillin-insensitive murein endopeptidase [Gaiellales bacterium]